MTTPARELTPWGQFQLRPSHLLTSKPGAKFRDHHGRFRRTELPPAGPIEPAPLPERERDDDSPAPWVGEFITAAWVADGLCAQTDPEIFFPEVGGSSKEAKRVCAACPVREQCRDWALEQGEVFGVWGGTTPNDRRKIRRARGRRRDHPARELTRARRRDGRGRGMSVRIPCEDCGYTASARTQGLAEYAFRRHSCESVKERAARAQRRIDRLAESGPERPCRHGDKHPHGDRVRYVIDKCRCRTCRDATARYNAQRRRQNLYGNAAYVDATPARDHVLALSAQGMGWKRVAAAAGLSNGVVWKLLYGDPQRNMAPSKRVRARTAQSILAVTLDLADGALIDATGTRRRLQALATLGWTVHALAERARLDRQRFDKVMRGNERVTKETADAVSRLYDDLWNARPEGGRSEATRRHAARLGWAPPLAWDDETIDDPAARADQGSTRHGADLDEWAYLVRSGERPDRAAERCGVRLGSIETAARRNGRDDVLRLLETAKAAA